MEPKKELERVTAAKDYKEWRKENSDSYLCSFFCIHDPDSAEGNAWQVSFYNKKQDSITTFNLPKSRRKKAGLLHADSKIFKQKGDIVEELIIDNEYIGDVEALGIAKECLAANHPSESITKEILLLQFNKDAKRAIWNITFMTSAFNMFNIKIDSKTKEVLDHSLRPAMELKKEFEKKP